MNKKLLSLAVAAAVAAPTAAMAEAVLYGKLNQSIDYQDVTNAIAPTYTTVDEAGVTLTEEGQEALAGFEGPVIVRNPAGDPLINNDGEDFSGWGISREGSFMQGSSRANRIGVKGSEDLGNGLKAIYQVELGLNLTAADDDIDSGNNGISYRNSFVGLAGDWGTVLAGRHDTPLKISTGKLDMFSDTMADYNGTVGFDDVRADNVVAYISPSFSGFSFAGAVVAPGGATVDTFGGGDTNIDNDSLASAWSLALIYNNGPFYGSAAYEVLGADHFMDSNTALAGNAGCINTDGTETLSCSYIDDDYSKWRIGLGLLDWNGFSLSAIYEQQDDLPGGQVRNATAFVNPDGTVDFLGVTGVKEQRLWQVQAGYSFGNNMVKAMYGAVDRDADRPLDSFRANPRAIGNLTDDLEGDRETWAIGFDHNFSKRTKAYALYVDVTDDSNKEPGGANEFNGFSLGVVHKF
ncbi:hypothetical protein CKO31_24490 [Thiohalocapsa halophila]|uniref:Porin domain-containing protein n=1 Tax=Thiohalocapsa halophila TaxID=69359 RepID=A0ABS1CPS8_9GAMM|nr:hypothetical protein [Thiohalocapsa halophila]